MVKSSKINNLGAIGGNTGGHPVIHNVDSGELTIKVPQPTPTEKPAEKVEPEKPGFAKASPTFKAVTPQTKASKEEEEKALKNNEVKDDDKASE